MILLELSPSTGSSSIWSSSKLSSPKDLPRMVFVRIFSTQLSSSKLFSTKLSSSKIFSDKMVFVKVVFDKMIFVRISKWSSSKFSSSKLSSSKVVFVKVQSGLRRMGLRRISLRRTYRRRNGLRRNSLGAIGFTKKKNSFGAKGRGKGKSYRAKSRRQRSPEGIVINVKRYDMVLQVNQFRDGEILSAITY